ncbi:hypothetical protein [Bremerella cremea]|uniref:hypothetical protein n=1 Tax=Bremerella cremea TaxID=1031537 RepID=UPI0031E51D0F
MVDATLLVRHLESNETIPLRDVHAAMESNNLLVLGLLREVVTRHPNRIFPKPDWMDCRRAIVTYLLLCVEQKPELDEYVLSPYLAMHDLLGMMRHWQLQPGEEQTLVPETLERLRQLYLRGSAETQLCIENGFLEHFLEDRNNLSLLGRWKTDPQTATAIQESLKWSEGT